MHSFNSSRGNCYQQAIAEDSTTTFMLVSCHLYTICACACIDNAHTRLCRRVANQYCRQYYRTLLFTNQRDANQWLLCMYSSPGHRRAGCPTIKHEPREVRGDLWGYEANWQVLSTKGVSQFQVLLFVTLASASAHSKFTSKRCIIISIIYFYLHT